jgi:hypothetical protein
MHANLMMSASPFVGSPLSYASVSTMDEFALQNGISQLGDLHTSSAIPSGSDGTTASAGRYPPRAPDLLVPPSLPTLVENEVSGAASHVSKSPPSNSALTQAIRNSNVLHEEESISLRENEVLNEESVQPPSQLFPTSIVYNEKGSDSAVCPEKVFITGTFNMWQHKVPLVPQLTPSGAPSTWSVVLQLPAGIHRLKFIVDDEWRCSRQLPTAQDEDGNLVNYIEVSGIRKDATNTLRYRSSTVPSKPQDFSTSLQTPMVDPRTSVGSKPALQLAYSLPARTESVRRKSKSFPCHSRPESPPGQYSRSIPTPDSLARLAYNSAASGSAGAGSVSLIAVQGAHQSERALMINSGSESLMIDPPALPVHLTKVLLNYVSQDEESIPVPAHVVLNHLYACSIKDGVMAVAVTSRYKHKHVTTVLYRPVPI